MSSPAQRVAATLEQAQFSVRAVSIDYQLVPPRAPLDPTTAAFWGGAPVHRVPVVRVFGATPTGQRCCLHIHGVLPYFLLPLDADAARSRQATEAHIRHLAVSLEAALALSLRPSASGPVHHQPAGHQGPAPPPQPPQPPQPPPPPPPPQHRHFVHKITLVKAQPFYGYGESDRFFIKVYLYDPGLVTRAMALLRRGAVLNRSFQLYEAHVPFLLQLFIDYNLYGMGMVCLRSVRFRLPLPAGRADLPPSSPLLVLSRVWTVDTVPPDAILHGARRASHCELEVDAVAQDIANRAEIVRLPLSTSPSLRDQPLVQSLALIWQDEQLRKRQDPSFQLTVSSEADREGRYPPYSPAQEHHLEVFRRVLAADAAGEPPQQPPPSAARAHQPARPRPSPALSSAEEMWISEAGMPVESPHLAPPPPVGGATSQPTPARPATASPAVSSTFGHEIEFPAEPTHRGSVPEIDQDAVHASQEDLAAVAAADSDDDIDDELFDVLMGFANERDGTDILLATQGSDDEEDEDGSGDGDAAADSQDDPLGQPPTIPQFDGPGDDAPPRRRLRVAPEYDDGAPLRRRPRIAPEYDDGGPPRRRLRIVPQYDGPDDEGDDDDDDDNSPPAPISRLDLVRKLVARRQAPPTDWFSPAAAPPSFREVELAGVINQPPYYSRAADKPARPVVLARIEFDLPVRGAAQRLPDFPGSRPATAPTGNTWLRPVRDPPHPALVERWLDARTKEEERLPDSHDRHQQRPSARAPTQVLPSAAPFLYTPEGAVNRLHDNQNLRLLSIEVHARSRGALLPNPMQDPVLVIVVIEHDQTAEEKVGPSYRMPVRLLVLNDAYTPFRFELSGADVEYFDDEADMLLAFAALVRRRDPDFLVAFEAQMASVGYLVERAARLGAQRGTSRAMDLLDLMGRAQGNLKPRDDWGAIKASGMHVTGRIILNVWRIMRKELKLPIYTFENIAYHVLHRRIPLVPAGKLSEWYERGAGTRGRTVGTFVERTRVNIELLLHLDIVGRTSEFARVFGIDFYSVMTRGSQYRVESMLLRLVRPQNMLLISPSKEQVANQYAAEAFPLIMEPESRFYPDPVAVLDFRSLYPSIIIAYNLCYSTCLGRVSQSGSGSGKKFGVSRLSLDSRAVAKLVESGQVWVSPNGVAFVKPAVRRGILPRLLQEILDTRFMVKRALKDLPPSQKALARVLDARQLGLKLIANVTYGYTGASYSGRMPCVDIADTIVETGRQTLERAMRMVEAEPRWRAHVAYGDTDSQFVVLKGATRDEAFRIGKEIAAAVTADNPAPVKLQFEKVYHPCFLVTKKRYVGAKYESPSQREAVLDAKGIEAVRRDSCPIVIRLMEESLRLFFRDPDGSRLKQYLQGEFASILAGRLPLHEFVFAKEVRLGAYRGPHPPPAAIVAQKRMRMDPRAEPRLKERVRYVVIHGDPNSRLVDLVVDPMELVCNTDMRLNGVYYIAKQLIPSLSRIFELAGLSIRQWYQELPRTLREPLGRRTAPSRSVTLDRFFAGTSCIVCNQATGPRAGRGLCDECRSEPAFAGRILLLRVRRSERHFARVVDVCRACIGATGWGAGEIGCESLDCPAFFERVRLQRQCEAMRSYLTEMDF